MNPPTTYTLYAFYAGSMVLKADKTQSFDYAPSNEVSALVLMVTKLIKLFHPLTIPGELP